MEKVNFNTSLKSHTKINLNIDPGTTSKTLKLSEKNTGECMTWS